MKRGQTLTLKKVYYDTAEVAKMIGLTTEKARYWLKREGVVRKRGGRYYTTISRLMSAFPEAFQSVAR